MHVRCTAHPQATMIKTGCNRAKPFIMALLCIIAMACLRDSDSGGIVRSDLPLNRLHDGDLLFRCGVGAASQAVIEMDKNKGMYTHIGKAEMRTARRFAGMMRMRYRRSADSVT